MNNTFYKGYYEDHYLAHHGILGMKWGKKNGPPYPLGASDHSASEKSAGWRKSLDGRKRHSVSVEASARRALAKVYGVNANFYSKSNKSLSSINKSLMNKQLKKAEEAQAASDENAYRKKANNLNKKIDKKLEKSQKADSKILEKREKYVSKKLDKFDKKIEKTKNGTKAAELKSKKKEFEKDFREGTKYIEAGQKRYNDIIKKYNNVKLEALADETYKKNQEYKDAVKKYSKQKLNDMFNSGGSNATKLFYAVDSAKESKKKR